MSELSALLDSIPVGDIAKQVGVDEDTAEDAIRQILPGLVGGMKANTDAGGGASLERALGRHQGRAHLKAADVDTDDGAKIVRNVFGERTDTVAAKLADASPKSNVTSDLIQKLLPIVAPIVLSWLASRFLGQQKQADPQQNGGGSGGGIGDILGGLLGGGSGGSSGGGDVLGGILGGLLGGGKR